MTLYDFVESFKNIALKQPSVHSAFDGSVYDNLNGNPHSRYCVFNLSQTTHREEENFDIYGANLFMIDRQDSTLKNNILQVQSISKELLSNIIKAFCKKYDAKALTIVYHPFVEKFVDLCCGMYATVEIEVPKDSTCEEDY